MDGRNWDEFGEMIGAKSAPHRIEQGVMKVYDPASPVPRPSVRGLLRLRLRRSAAGNIAFVPGKPEAQGYYVFALPRGQ